MDTVSIQYSAFWLCRPTHQNAIKQQSTDRNQLPRAKGRENIPPKKDIHTANKARQWSVDRGSQKLHGYWILPVFPPSWHVADRDRMFCGVRPRAMVGMWYLYTVPARYRHRYWFTYAARSKQYGRTIVLSVFKAAAWATAQKCWFCDREKLDRHHVSDMHIHGT